MCCLCLATGAGSNSSRSAPPSSSSALQGAEGDRSRFPRGHRPPASTWRATTVIGSGTVASTARARPELGRVLAPRRGARPGGHVQPGGGGVGVRQRQEGWQEVGFAAKTSSCAYPRAAACSVESVRRRGTFSLGFDRTRLRGIGDPSSGPASGTRSHGAADCLSGLNGLRASRGSAALALVAARRAEALPPAQESAVCRVRRSVSQFCPRTQPSDAEPCGAPTCCPGCAKL